MEFLTKRFALSAYFQLFAKFYLKYVTRHIFSNSLKKNLFEICNMSAYFQVICEIKKFQSAKSKKKKII